MVKFIFVIVNITEAQTSVKESLFSISSGYASFNSGDQGGMFLSNNYIRNTKSTFVSGFLNPVKSPKHTLLLGI